MIPLAKFYKHAGKANSMEFKNFIAGYKVLNLENLKTQLEPLLPLVTLVGKLTDPWAIWS